MTDESVGAEPTRRSWRTPVVVIGTVLAVLVAGVVGVVVGRMTAPGPDVVVTGGPVLEESPGVEQLPVGVASASPSPSPTASATPVLTLAAGTQPASPVVMTADPGLPDTPGTATGYRLVNAGISRPQVAGVLASVLGVDGTAAQAGDTWVVREGTGPVLTVESDPLVSWQFEDQQTIASPAAGAPLASDRAITLASALLGSIGVDTGSVDWQVDRYAGMTQVTAWQLVADARTQLAWRIGFDPAGAVVQASGFSAGLEAVPGYPVVGAATAVARASQPGWSAVGPTAIPDAAVPAEASASASPSASPSATPDKPALVVPITPVTVTGAELSLAQYWQSDGGMLILPAYVLAGEDGSRWSMLAVADDYVQFVDGPEPSGPAS